MRATITICLFFFANSAWPCLFEIENAELDATCSSDITSYELDTYYSMRPPKISVQPQPEFNQVKVGAKTYSLPASFSIFDKTTKENEKVKLEFRKQNKTFRTVTIHKLPKDFPNMKVRGRASPGYFVMAAMRVNGDRSFALILDHEGGIVFSRAFDRIICDFRKHGSVYIASAVEMMLSVSMLGHFKIYSDPLQEVGEIKPDDVKTDWGGFPLDLHDLIYLNKDHYFYIRTYPVHDLYWGCVLRNEIVEVKNGSHEVVFSSDPYLWYQDRNRINWPVMSVLQCKAYFHLNSMQNLGDRRFLLSARATNEIYLWSDRAPFKGWALGPDSKTMFADLEVTDWLGQHTPDLWAETNQIILFDNGRSTRFGDFGPIKKSSSLVRVTLSPDLIPVSSQRLNVFADHLADSMGSTQWYDADTVVIGAGYSIVPKKFDIQEMTLSSRKLNFEVRFLDRNVMIYRAHKVKSL